MEKKTKPRDSIPYIDPQEFWSHVEKGPGCWNWIFKRAIGKQARALITIDGITFSASRVAWKLRYGKDPYPWCMLHKCDNGRCVRPYHLFKGSYQDNIKDCISKGRKPYPKCYKKTTMKLKALRSLTRTQRRQLVLS